jgi:general secretion pathway protein K
VNISAIVDGGWRMVDGLKAGRPQLSDDFCVQKNGSARGAFRRLAPPTTHHPLSTNSGSALLAVLWIIALLSLLVATTSLLVMQDVDTVGVRRQMFRARMLAEMGLAFASHPDVKPDDPLLHQVVAEGEGFDVEIRGEDGRLNPNVLLQRQDRETLRRVFRFWGMDLVQADGLIDALIDWTDQDSFTQPKGAEFRQYNIPGVPFNRPFRSVEEMSLVRGMAQVEAVYPGWRDWFSIHSSGALDINEAEPEVLAAITGADIVVCQQVQARRVGRDGIRNTRDDSLLPDLQTALRLLGVPGNPEALIGILTVQSNTRRIISHGTTGGFTKSIVAVVQGSPQGGGVASTILELVE